MHVIIRTPNWHKVGYSWVKCKKWRACTCLYAVSRHPNQEASHLCNRKIHKCSLSFAKEPLHVLHGLRYNWLSVSVTVSDKVFVASVLSACEKVLADFVLVCTAESSTPCWLEVCAVWLSEPSWWSLLYFQKPCYGRTSWNHLLETISFLSVWSIWTCF